jgi:CRISPR-associated exonuclease Cas4
MNAYLLSALLAFFGLGLFVIGMRGRAALPRGRIVYIDSKSLNSAAPPQPHEGHILQLAAYCQLVESTSGRRPPFGIIRYQDHTFRVNFTHTLRQALRRSLHQIRQWGPTTPYRSHNRVSRCRACGYKIACDQSLE